MDHHTYKLIELVGTSENTIEDAIRGAIERASQTLKGLDWFEVTEARGVIRDGKISEYQVKLKVGFRLMKDEDL
jgi:dodecin